MNKIIRTGAKLILGIIFLSLLGLLLALARGQAAPLAMPEVGERGLAVVATNWLEVTAITRKDPDPAPLTEWTFVDAAGTGAMPPAASFVVTANGVTNPVVEVGFKRRVGYAPLRVRDLRLDNRLYLRLSNSLPGLAIIKAWHPNLWPGPLTVTNLPLRQSPAIHVNQAGYQVGLAKKAMIGFYLGNIGELTLTNLPFDLLNASGQSVFSGRLQRRPDVGYTYSPTPYQQVYEADFSPVNGPGEYRVHVPGLGTSYPFPIGDVAGAYARTYALGIYHQRCGTDNVLPFTRHTHRACHTNLLLIPYAPGPEQDFVNYVVNQESAGAAGNPRHTAPRLTSVNASLYPFVNTNQFDGRGGHHDAGDYSKYTTSVSQFVHLLLFAVDNFPGVARLDNLGLPESGDGISDVLQETKWEADYLAKLQDADGGFYFIVYPRTRQYELDKLPEDGDAQLVLPKNTAATAAAVAALAECASSPAFKAQWPTVASAYLTKALKGWSFLTNAIARYGRDGSYQMVTFSGDVFMHDDELAWAGAALYAATGDPQFQQDLLSNTPNPNSGLTRRWSWWSCFGGYGNAFRAYAFAARSGRLLPAQLNAAYLNQCEQELRQAATNTAKWSGNMAYGSSFMEDNKSFRAGGWYFSGEWTFDAAVGLVLDGRADYLDVITKNFNYELGCNPVNVTYLTGLGTKRQREIVHQYALNDHRVLPPAGVPLGNIQAQYDYLELYKTERTAVSYPKDDSADKPFAYYDRWADTFNVTTEFVVSQTARTLPAAALLMAMTPAQQQPWRPDTMGSLIYGWPSVVSVGSPIAVTVDGISDLNKAIILWEGRDQQPAFGRTNIFVAKSAGPQWLEAEAQWPDGRRLVWATNFNAVLVVTNPIESYSPGLATDPSVVAWYKLDGDLTDAKGHVGLARNGAASVDTNSFIWSNRPSGAALRVNGLGDSVTVNLPCSDLAGGTGVSIEAMVYVNRQVAYGNGNANLLVLTRNWNAELAWRHNIWKTGSEAFDGANQLADVATLSPHLKTGQWQHIRMQVSSTNARFYVNGQLVSSIASGNQMNWGTSGTMALRAGDFDGWIDEIIVKR